MAGFLKLSTSYFGNLKFFFKLLLQVTLKIKGLQK